MSKEAKRVSERLSATLREDALWELDRPFSIIYDYIVHTAEKGFTTDFSSLPAPVRAFQTLEEVAAAGTIHDKLYRTGKVSRRVADRIWREIAVAGSPHAATWKAWLMWLGLRIGGWVAWRKHRKNDARN